MISKDLKGALHSYSFRIALLYVLLFLISTLILFIFIFVTSTRSSIGQLDETLQSDKIAFLDRYEQSGLNGLIRLVNSRAQSLGNEVAYSLTTHDDEIIAGNLATWPLPFAPAPVGIMELKLGISGDQSRQHNFRAEVIQLAEGYSLLLARSKQNIVNTQNKLRKTFIWAALITLALGLFGGYLLSKRAVRRIASINRLCQTIVNGDFGQRLTVTTVHDDLDNLSLNINEMLNKIENLMEEIVQVSDNIAHDMRTPLSRLRLKLEAIQSQSSIDDHTRDQLSESIESADAIIDTFNALLRISKIQVQKRVDQFETINLSTVIDDVIDLYTPLLEDKQLQLKRDIVPAINLKGDRNLIFQAVSNLLDNAIKYTPAQGTITVTLSRDTEMIELAICDTGPGVPEAELAHLSQRFYRGDSSRSLPGNGLGLSLVEAIAQVHQANLAFSHTRPKGLCAQLKFPVTLM